MDPREAVSHLVHSAQDNGGPAQGFNGNMASNWPLRGMKRTLWEGGVRGTSFITGAGISGGRTSMELHASTDWMPSILSVVLNGVSADPTSADRVPWTAVFDEAEPPFQLGDGMDCWAALATTATALPGLRRMIVPAVVALGFAILSHANGLAWQAASQEVRVFRGDLARAADQHGPGPEYLVIEPPGRVRHYPLPPRAPRRDCGAGSS